MTVRSSGGLLVTALLATAALGAAEGDAPALAGYLRQHAQAPADYVLATARSHRITILGEAHWLRQDVMLVAEVIPRLQKAGVDLAAEVLPASEQARIDELLASPEWNERDANAIMRGAAWPYREYRDLLRAAWSANQGAERRIKILALGPPADWRDVLLPRGITYDAFMADLVAKHLAEAGRRVMVYCGMHHAFTRYYQAELDNAGHASGYMDRMGNILSRRFGEQVFLIALHKPIWCGSPAEPSHCLPFGGRVDCAGMAVGHPVGFDVVCSPFAELPFEPGDYYGYGRPALRFVDYADGYVWSGAIESFRAVTIIPLNEYAPDTAALAQVGHEDPFEGERDVSVQRLQEIWAQETEASPDLLAKRKWKHLSGWQQRCQVPDGSTGSGNGGSGVSGSLPVAVNEER
jgi:hypothetical protein